MATFLFDDIIFGPVKSRRLGNSLGINLLPAKEKVCNFNCIYCECGLSFTNDIANLPGKTEILQRLEEQLVKMKKEGNIPDSITFAGNGEPTMHPHFYAIMQGTVTLKNRYFPKSIVSVLTNASLIHEASIREALDMAEQNIIKLDSANEETMTLINCPDTPFHLDEFISNFKKFKQKPMLQTLFVRGEINGKKVDNLTESEIDGWLNTIKQIRPKSVMIYTIARDTALAGLKKVEKQELEQVGKLVETTGIPVLISS